MTALFKYRYGKTMKTAKLIVMYPTPTDVDAFEKRYAEEHVPMAVEKLAGKTRFVASQIKSTVGQEQAPFHRIAEVYFPSMLELDTCLNSPGGQETAQHAVDISTGGAPLFLTAEVESFDF
jgi:uncharacterized protein (TIGR02118 family)